MKDWTFNVPVFATAMEPYVKRKKEKGPAGLKKRVYFT
jgi:hypothetical protein